MATTRRPGRGCGTPPLTDPAVAPWWPAYAALQHALRAAGRADIAGALDEAVARGTMSAEVLGGVGAVLRAHEASRAALDAPGRAAWDAVMRDALGAGTVQAFLYRLRRLFRP